jgi:hypothetical protein
MKQLLASLVTATLVGCQSSPYPVSNATRFAFPSIAFHGKHAPQLTVDDVRQIVAIAKSRSDILKPIDVIEVGQPNEAEVESGNPQKSGDPLSNFKVRKENGHWKLIEKSVDTTNRTIITS